MSFLFPAVLMGAAAAAVPLAVHLWMRSRPRRVSLATERFVRTSLERSSGRLKLRQVLLLAMRMLLAGLLAGLLARLVVPVRAAQGPGPTDLVVVLDDSLSMDYRVGGQSALQRGQEAAGSWLASLPAGSAGAVLPARPGGRGQWLASLELAGSAVWDVRVTGGGWSVAGAIRRATGLLDGRDANRRLLVVTDLTRRGSAGLAEAVESLVARGVECVVLDVGADRWANAWIADIRADPPAVAPGGACEIVVTVRSEHRSGTARLVAETDGREVAAAPVTLQPNGQAVVRLPLRPRRPGLLTGQVRLEPTDALPADDTRGWAVLVRKPATLLLVTAPQGADRTADLLSAALARALTGEATARPRRIRPEALDAESLTRADVVAVLGPAPLANESWTSLRRFVRGGGALWVLAGPAATASDRPLLPAKVLGVETLAEPQPLAEPDTTLPLLEPFADPANPLLGAVRARRRLELSAPREDATVLLRFADGAPALLRRPEGDGEVLLWATSPDRAWSNLGQLGGQWVVLAQRARELAWGSSAKSLAARPGEAVVADLPAGLGSPRVELLGPGQRHGQPVAPDLRSRTLRLELTETGLWRLRFTDAGRSVERAVLVAPPAGESDLARLDAAGQASLGQTGATIVRELPPPAPTGGATVEQRELLPAVVLVLLVVLAGESWLANRFYPKPIPSVA